MKELIGKRVRVRLKETRKGCSGLNTRYFWGEVVSFGRTAFVLTSVVEREGCDFKPVGDLTVETADDSFIDVEPVSAEVCALGTA